MRSLIVAVTIALSLPASAHPLQGRIVETASGDILAEAGTLVQRLKGADVVVLGEVHDNPLHHEFQADIVTALAPAGLSFEMVAPEDESMLARLRRERAPAAVLGAALRWEERGWPDFAMYAPIFEAAGRAEVTGGAVDPRILALAMEEGAAVAGRSALGASVVRYGLEADLDEAMLAEAVAEQVRAHCDAIPEALAERMVEAQRVRDAAFADAVLRARALGDDGQVVLIAGKGHGRIDRGVPALVERAAPNLQVVTIAFAEVREGAEDWQAYAGGGPSPLYDYLWFTEAAEREAPCIAFRRSRGLD